MPPYPGVTAALGLLVTDAVYEYVTTTYQRMSQLNASELQARFEELEEQARDQLERDGIPHEKRVIQRVADCRYLGQGYELRVEAVRARSTPSGRPSSRRSSTTRTSASTRAASRSPTSRSRTSGCGASA